jgi:hypothetical protein
MRQGFEKSIKSSTYAPIFNNGSEKYLQYEALGKMNESTL